MLKKGNFLRNRNNSSVDFKLDMPEDNREHNYCMETNFSFDNFTLTEGLREVHKIVGLKLNENFVTFEQYLKANNMCQLAVVDKFRKIYKLDELTISFDENKDIGKFIEAEINLPDGTIFDKKEIREFILQKLLDNNLIDKNYIPMSTGYVEMYLKKHNPYAYRLGLFK